MTARHHALGETVSGSRAGVDLWSLRIVHPRDVVQTIPLAADEGHVIGRAPPQPGASTIPHRTVSRVHARIEHTAGAWTICDLSSHNGSWCDGVRLGERAVPMHEGAVVRMGDTLAVLERATGIQGNDGPVSREAVPGDSPVAARLRAAIAAIANDPSPVLLIGEIGTGKELIAHELHRLSQRRGPLVPFSCAGLDATIERQLFGHDSGAQGDPATDHRGRFREAHTGTLFLDEIGELAAELQPRLLRVIETGSLDAIGEAELVDVRIVAATNRELGDVIEHRGFHHDLHARLAVHELRVPPLRERRGDILLWLDLLAEIWADRRDRPRQPLELRPDAAEALLRFPWPGNLRDLDRVVHMVSPLYDGSSIALGHLPGWLRGPGVSETPSPETRDDDEPPIGLERQGIPGRDELLAVLTELDWMITAVAQHFGRDRRQVHRWMDGYGLRRDG